ncbi:MAG: 4Fe-4S dicluster domain-containing protein [Thermovirgaceae bacterium]
MLDEKEKFFNSGVLVEPRKGAVQPPEDLWLTKKNGLVVIECPQRIPCNPCHTSCPTGAVKPFKDINDQPEIDYEKCTGCANCVAVCPGLACFVVDLTWSDEDKALMKLPYEMLPLPVEGEITDCLNRVGEAITRGKVIKVLEPFSDRTRIVHVEVPRSLVMEIRAIRVVK